MTSKERHEARYQRRSRKRAEKKMAACAEHDDFEKVFSYKNLYRAYKKCRKQVGWKASVQKYITQAPLNVYRTYKQLKEGKFRSKGFYEFDINERGKIRHIQAVNIEERVVQRCLCDNALVPVLGRTFIYDNAASLENRGYHFAIRRCCENLRKHYRKYGTEGYALLFDFSKFFETISHAECKRIMREEFSDQRILAQTDHFIDCFGNVGLGLGSQISQTFALAIANSIDHYIKDVCGIKGYVRFMDDGCLIHKNKTYLLKCFEGIKKLCAELSLKINVKKTQIRKLTHGFTFLKARIMLAADGAVIKKIPHDSVTRERRKLKKYVPFVADGLMELKDVLTSFQSWYAYADNFRSYHTKTNMQRLVTSLFIFA